MTVLFTGLLLLILMPCCSNTQKLVLDESNGGDAIVGKWSGKQTMTVRYKPGFMKFEFVKSKDSLQTLMEITKDGEVNGTIGGAEFLDCRVIKNRGAIARKLNLATDFAIEGKIKGFLFSGDTIPEMNISIPLYMKDGNLNGDIFQKDGMDVFPMCGIDLKK